MTNAKGLDDITSIFSVPDNSISTLSKFLCYGVSLINDKVLVEDLEYFATLELGHGDVVEEGEMEEG